MSSPVFNSQQETVPGRPQFKFGSWTQVWRPRIFWVNVALLIATVGIGILSLTVGDYQLALAEVYRAIFVDRSGLQHDIVTGWRGSRAVAGITVGMALGLAGAIFQTITRNPLASPDILGVTTGASAFAVTALLASGGLLKSIGVPASAFIGGLLVSLIIGFLARGGLDSFRLVFAGVIMNSLCAAYITFVIVRADIRHVGKAQVWLSGSLGQANWDNVLPVILIVGLALPLLGWLTFQLEALSLGSQTATALGVPARRTQGLLLLMGVLAAAVAVSLSGPIAFVAFVAPHLTRWLTGQSSAPMFTSMLAGALVVVASDLVVRALLPGSLPVGLVTAAIGGALLLQVLVSQNRKVTL